MLVLRAQGADVPDDVGIGMVDIPGIRIDAIELSAMLTEVLEGALVGWLEI